MMLSQSGLELHDCSLDTFTSTQHGHHLVNQVTTNSVPVNASAWRNCLKGLYDANRSGLHPQTTNSTVNCTATVPSMGGGGTSRYSFVPPVGGTSKDAERLACKGYSHVTLNCGTDKNKDSCYLVPLPCNFEVTQHVNPDSQAVNSGSLERQPRRQGDELPNPTEHGNRSCKLAVSCCEQKKVAMETDSKERHPCCWQDSGKFDMMNPVCSSSASPLHSAASAREDQHIINVSMETAFHPLSGNHLTGKKMGDNISRDKHDIISALSCTGRNASASSNDKHGKRAENDSLILQTSTRDYPITEICASQLATKQKYSSLHNIQESPDPEESCARLACQSTSDTDLYYDKTAVRNSFSENNVVPLTEQTRVGEKANVILTSNKKSQTTCYKENVEDGSVLLGCDKEDQKRFEQKELERSQAPVKLGKNRGIAGKQQQVMRNGVHQDGARTFGSSWDSEVVLDSPLARKPRKYFVSSGRKAKVTQLLREAEMLTGSSASAGPVDGQTASRKRGTSRTYQHKRNLLLSPVRFNKSGPCRSKAAVSRHDAWKEQSWNASICRKRRRLMQPVMASTPKHKDGLVQKKEPDRATRHNYSTNREPVKNTSTDAQQCRVQQNQASPSCTGSKPSSVGKGTRRKFYTGVVKAMPQVVQTLHNSQSSVDNETIDEQQNDPLLKQRMSCNTSERQKVAVKRVRTASRDSHCKHTADSTFELTSSNSPQDSSLGKTKRATFPDDDSGLLQVPLAVKKNSSVQTRRNRELMKTSMDSVLCTVCNKNGDNDLPRLCSCRHNLSVSNSSDLDDQCNNISGPTHVFHCAANEAPPVDKLGIITSFAHDNEHPDLCTTSKDKAKSITRPHTRRHRGPARSKKVLRNSFKHFTMLINASS